MNSIDKKIKVGVICDQFGNLQRGGAELQVENTVNYLVKTGVVDVEYITYQTTDLSQYDIIHIFKSIFEFTPVALSAKKLGIPYVLSTITFPKNYWFDLYTYKFSRFLPLKMKSIFSPGRRITLWDNADFLFPNTDMEAEFLRKVTANRNIEIVPNGLDLTEFTPPDEKYFFSSYPELKNKKFVLNVARIEKRKNQKNLIFACKELNIPLVVIGKIGDENYYQEILDIGYTNFYYLGPLYNRELLFSAYAACQVFCLPSTVETPGIAAMEAAYYNKPLVITKKGGTQYYFNDKALYVDWKDIKGIKNAILASYNKNNVNTKDLISEYSWDKVAAKYIRLYRQILANKK